jgi:hypothetical protein
MLCPKTWVLKRTRMPGIESPPNSTKNLGSNRNPSIGGRTRSLGDQDQAQRCTKQLPMIPTNKSEPKHHRIEGTSRTRKTDENSSKKRQKTNELQTGNRRNHESFHSLGGQILYKRRKNLTLESKEMRSRMDGLPGNPRANIYESPPGQAKDHTTPST